MPQSMPSSIGTTAAACPVPRPPESACGKTPKFIGAIVFAWGANLRLAGEFGLEMTECAELCRVALTKHQTPVSRIVTIAAKMLKRTMPGIRLIVSYADPEHGHVGTIYQAMGWVYVGESKGPGGMMLKGKPTHRRTINSKYGTSSVVWLKRHVDRDACIIKILPKHKYLLRARCRDENTGGEIAKALPETRSKC